MSGVMKSNENTCMGMHPVRGLLACGWPCWWEWMQITDCPNVYNYSCSFVWALSCIQQLVHWPYIDLPKDRLSLEYVRVSSLQYRTLSCYDFDKIWMPSFVCIKAVYRWIGEYTLVGEELNWKEKCRWEDIKMDRIKVEQNRYQGWNFVNMEIIFQNPWKKWRTLDQRNHHQLLKENQYNKISWYVIKML